ncbi:MAG: peptidoglycan-binding protein, partial [Syntrophales bacterium]
MKNYFFNICIIGLAIFASFSTSDTVDELIRRKVEENLPAYNTLNRNDKIFCTPSVREVYFKNNFKPFWGNTEQVSELISAIEKCDNEGLNPDDYHLSVILRLKQNKSAENDADLDIILTDAFLLYTSHILSGKTNPLTIKAEWHVLKTDKNPVKYLYEINSKGINKILSEIKPQNKNYNYLISALKVYRDIEKNGGWKRVDKGKVIKLGMSDKRIAKIRQRLRITNDYTVNDPTDIDSYDDTLKLAVVNFQKRHGLEALGNIGDQTIEKLNIPVMEKIKSIVVNLERLRWLPLEDPRYYLLVNIANFELDV